MDNTILVRGRAEEEAYITSEAMTPGELVLYAATEGQIKANDASADVDAMKAWVREQEENKGAGVDDDIASGDEATVIFPTSGAKIRALIAHGTNVQQGAALESDGNGALQARTSGRTVAFADSDTNNTSGSASLAIVRVA